MAKDFKAVKIAGLRAHNETIDSFWLELESETWLGSKFHGMLLKYLCVCWPKHTPEWEVEFWNGCGFDQFKAGGTPKMPGCEAAYVSL